MANENITYEEWLELYRYLLTQLESRGFREIRAEIETAASAPVFEESSPEEQNRISILVRGDVGHGVTRRRRPQEVFETAIGVLHSRLLELPQIAVGVAKHLHVQPADIDFRIDYERYALSESPPVPLSDFIVTEHEAEAIRTQLEMLGTPRVLRRME